MRKIGAYKQIPGCISIKLFSPFRYFYVLIQCSEIGKAMNNLLNCRWVNTNQPQPIQLTRVKLSEK